MYAVIETGGKQYRVEVGTELEVEYLDVAPGEAITIDRVLLVSDAGQAAIGQPHVTDALVRAEVVRQTRGEKLISFKYRPKARSRVKKGHRQELTVLRVTDVQLGGRSAADDVRAAEETARSERDRLQEAAARQAAADAALAAQLAESRPAEAPTSAAVRRRGRAAESETETADTDTSEATGTPAAEAPARGRGTAKASAAEPAEGVDTSDDESTTTAKKPRASRTKATDDTPGSTSTGEDA